ncbi:MAG TPA: hypothetical protein ENJ84_09855 [Gammaproteobacteria bacterium]|nr:hypothetical protein [Gammaproteobacteria bacterium]
MTNKQQVIEEIPVSSKEDGGSQARTVPRRNGPSRLKLIALVVAFGLIGSSFFLEDKPLEKEDPPSLAIAKDTTVTVIDKQALSRAELEQNAGKEARLLIADLEKKKEKVDDRVLFEQASQYALSGKKSDAYLLYFYLGLQGNGPAAMKLATMADPAYFSAEDSMLDSPEPYEAYKWYKKASEMGEEMASVRLEKLRNWLQSVADKGDQRAQRLLLQWR